MKRIPILLVLLAAASFAHAQSVGRVIMAVGDVSALRAGANVPLRPGAEIQGGDQMRTGTESYAQVRFTDGAIFALRSETEFRVDEFRFGGKADGSERAFFSLVKGGFRTVTGIVGKLNQPNYRVRTPTSTIGIRGTHFNLVQCDGGCRGNDGTPAPNGTYGGVSDGRIAATPLNNPTERQFGSGEFFYVANANTPAAPLIAPPGFLTDKLDAQSRSRGQQQQADQATQQQREETQATQSSGIGADGRAQGQTLQATVPVTYTSTELKTTSGTSSVLPGFVPSGFVTVFTRAGTVFILTDDDNTSFTANSQGQLLAFGPTPNGNSGSLGSGSITDSGSYVAPDGTTVTWGAWTGNTLLTTASGSTTGTTVLFGTASDVKNKMDPSTGAVSFNYVGGPHPRDAAGNLADVTSSDARVDFGRQRFDFKMAMLFPNIVGFGPANLSVSGSGTKANNSNTFDYLGSVSGSCTGAGCQSASASGTVGFGFGGASGPTIGVAGGGLINATRGGDVTFLNGYSGGAVTTPKALSVGWASASAQGFTPMEEPNAILGFGASGFSSYGFSSGTVGGNLNGGTIVEQPTGAAVATAAAAGNMFWGRWTGTAVQVNNGSTAVTNPPTGVPFIGGDRTDVMPTSGSAIYNYIGGPNPTSVGGSVGTFGGGAFNVNFATRAIAVSTPLTLSVGPNAFTLASCSSGCNYNSGSPTTPLMTLVGTCTGGGCSTANANMSGVFVGTQAQGLATSGVVNGGASTVVFSAGFAR